MANADSTQSDSPRNLPIAEWNRDHTLYVLREAKRGRSVGDINREAKFSYWGSMHVAFRLREEDYIREAIVGKRAVAPYVMQGGFQVADEAIWRGELTEKGEDLLRELEESRSTQSGRDVMDIFRSDKAMEAFGVRRPSALDGHEYHELVDENARLRRDLEAVQHVLCEQGVEIERLRDRLADKHDE